MSDLCWPTNEQMERPGPFCPRRHGKPRVDDRRVLGGGLIFVNRDGLRWRDALQDYGTAEMLHSRWKRWSEMDVFLRMMEGLVAAGAEPRTIMINATYLQAHRMESSLATVAAR